MQDHAITITGVDVSSTNPSQIDGFYICDSGRGLASDADRFVSASLMAAAFDVNDNDTAGLAVITNSSTQSLSSAGKIGSTVGAINNIIQQMAGYNTKNGSQIASDIPNNNQNAMNVIAYHSVA